MNKTLRLANDIIGICSEVDEVIHFIQNARLRMMQAYNTGLTSYHCGIDETDYAHSVIRITLKNGDKYILDLTGAQYGWQEILTPYNQYRQSKIREIKEILPFGGTRQYCKQRAEKSGGMAKWQQEADIGFGSTVNDILKLWQQWHMSLTTLLKLPDDQFQQQQAGLLEMVEAGMQKYKNIVAETGAMDLEGDIIVGGYDRKFKDVTGKAIN